MLSDSRCKPSNDLLGKLSDIDARTSLSSYSMKEHAAPSQAQDFMGHISDRLSAGLKR